MKQKKKNNTLAGHGLKEEPQTMTFRKFPDHHQLSRANVEPSSLDTAYYFSVLITLIGGYHGWGRLHPACKYTVVLCLHYSSIFLMGHLSTPIPPSAAQVLFLHAAGLRARCSELLCIINST